MEAQKRKGYMSAAQKQRLVDIMAEPEQNNLISGKLFPNFTKKDSDAKWESIALSLNSIPGGGVKSGVDWKRAWSDLKTKTKNKHMQVRKYASETGGGPRCPIALNNVEDKILSLINPTTIIGHNNVSESAVVFDLDENMDQDVTETVVNEEVEDDVFPDLMCETEQISPRSIVETPDIVSPKGRQLKRKKTRTVASVRLQESVQTSKQLVEMGYKKLALKEEYYNKKIKLLERQTDILERQTNILERQTNALEKIQTDIKEIATHHII